MKIAFTLLAAACLAGMAQSIHVHPSGTQLVFSVGTNSVTTDRRRCLGRIRQIELELGGLRDQLEIAQKMVREYPPRITVLEQEVATQRLHLKLMDVMGVTNAPSEPIVSPYFPPELPLNASVKSGLPQGYRPMFVPQRHVPTTRE